MKETYSAFGMANNGGMYFTYTGTSKRDVIRTIRNKTESKRLPGRTSSWTVRRCDGIAVAAGGVDSDNIRYRIHDDSLFYFDVH